MTLNSTVITLPNNTATPLAGEKTTAHVMSQEGSFYVGGSSVNGDNGILVGATQVFRIDLGRGDVLYGFALNSIVNVRVLTQG